MSPTANSAYMPFAPARRPGGKPEDEPRFRVVVHRKYLPAWTELIDRIGLPSAQRAWDYLATQPDQPPRIGQCTKLRGMAKYARDGWSDVYHYEASSMVRIDYQFHRNHQTSEERAPCPVVRILRISLSSH